MLTLKSLFPLWLHLELLLIIRCDHGDGPDQPPEDVMMRVKSDLTTNQGEGGDTSDALGIQTSRGKIASPRKDGWFHQ